jgi:secondary thiamine-phosphate synthase enzyme
VSIDVPVHDGRLAFGTWQGLYLAEWGGGGRDVEVVVTMRRVDDAKTTRVATVTAPSRGCHLVQDQIDAAIAPALNHALEEEAKRSKRSMTDGYGHDAASPPALVNLLVRHTSASLTVNENADPSVRVDMEGALNRIVPESWNDAMFKHVDEGPDDMPAHVKSTLFGASVTVPASGRRLRLGTWQGVYLAEHRNVGGFGGGHAREIACSVTGGGAQSVVTLTAPGRGAHDVTEAIAAGLKALRAAGGVGGGVAAGWLNLFIQHTSASLTVSSRAPAPAPAPAPATATAPRAAEAETEAAARLESALSATVPERWNDEFFTHTYEGPDDMPAHVKSSLMGASLTVPVVNGELGLGVLQGVFLCEHRDGGGFGCNLNRSVVLTLQGVDDR